jgi:hypothetical protein
MRDERSRASAAHELLMMNLAVFHLLLPVVALSSGHISILLTLSLIGSVLMIFWIAQRARRSNDGQLIHAHWQLAWHRCHLLLISYAVSTVIMLLGWLMAASQPDQNMHNIMLVVFSRIAVVPIVLMVLVLFVMSTTALSQARQGELPKKV